MPERGYHFLGLKAYSQRQGHLSVAQERILKAHFTEHPARNVGEVCAYILAECDQSYSSSGAAKLMRRLRFAYKEPQLLPAQADEAKQAGFIAQYEALMNGGWPQMRWLSFRTLSTPNTRAAPLTVGSPRGKRRP